MSRIVDTARFCITLAVSCFISIGATTAQPLQGGHIVYNEPPVPVGDFNACLLAATHGNVDAQIRLGDAYSSMVDRPVPLDYKQALYWYARAASHDDPVGLLKLGQMHDLGLGCNKDPMLAFAFYNKAAAMGLADAQYWTAQDYLQGHGVPQNQQVALDYLINAAKRGHPASQILLAEYYLGEIGPGTNARDNIAAYGWLSLAANGDSALSEYATQKLAECTSGMSLSQIIEAQGRTKTPDTLIGGPTLPVWQADVLVNSKLPKP